MSKLGERLKELRLGKNLLGKDLAAELDVDPSTLTNWEKGNRFPKEDMLIKLADYFNCSIDYLLGRTMNKDSVVYLGAIKDTLVTLEVHKDYPYNLTPQDIEKILSKLDYMGFNVDKMLNNIKNK